MILPNEPESPSRLVPNTLYLLSESAAPQIEIYRQRQPHIIRPFEKAGPGRWAKETLWKVSLAGTGRSTRWKFRIQLDEQRWLHPPHAHYFTTRLRSLWLQDGQIYAYQPAQWVSPARVIKLPHFEGRLPHRSLYIYMPRGYAEHTQLSYPVIYMHDGQNCFERYVEDSYAGSWKADLTADQLIAQGLMQECMIVGVSNGGKGRIAEYLPPYITTLPEMPVQNLHGEKSGLGDLTFEYYAHDIAPYIEAYYRATPGREQRAVCGSSMGGLISMYFAWDHPEFARHYAVISPSFWLTINQEGSYEMIERLRSEEPRDVRIWLDSGTRSTPTHGSDGRQLTIEARNALLENGYKIGPDFIYYLHKGAMHTESAWARRLPKIFEFLFPASPKTPGA